MKKIIALSALCLGILACSDNSPKSPELPTQTNETAQADTQNTNSTDGNVDSTKTQKDTSLMMSNMADPSSQDSVRQALNKYIDPKNVDKFMDQINDYNTAINQKSLVSGFVSTAQPAYDLKAISELWQGNKGDFIGTNCRINTFELLKGALKIPTHQADTSLLFMDSDAINVSGVVAKDDVAKFNFLFSRVATEATRDPHVHAAKMTEHFKDITFDDKARMLSVIIHDQLEGNHLFVGHVGVLVPDDGGFLFVEKLSFVEPYQAIKFATKDDAYDYLLGKYAIEYGQPHAQPFVMDNDKLAKFKDESTSPTQATSDNSQPTKG